MASWTIRYSAREVCGSTGKADSVQRNKQVMSKNFSVSVVKFWRAASSPMVSTSIGSRPRARLRVWRMALLTRATSALALPHALGATELVALVSNAIRQTRSLARGLDPIEVETIGLLAALQNLTTETEKFFDITCLFRCTESALPVDPQTSLALYRIVQEAIHNAITHGEARRIEINLAIDHGRLCLGIQDDGIGFQVASLKPAGMGLRVMHYRARAIGATFDIRSQPDQGTRIECLLPFTASVPTRSQLANLQ